MQVDAIKRGEDRTTFKETMDSVGVETARSEATFSVEGAEKIAKEIVRLLDEDYAEARKNMTSK